MADTLRAGRDRREPYSESETMSEYRSASAARWMTKLAAGLLVITIAFSF
jgi:hypothetical protein